MGNCCKYNKNNRIRIHRSTLHLLGNPEYIQLLVNPEQLMLAILPSQKLKTANAIKKLLPYEIFVANIEAGNDEQLIIKALVESFDLRVCGNSRPGCICCVATLEDLYRKYGYEILQRSLRLCIATWEGDVDSLTSNFLRGITHLITAYEDGLKDDMFVEKVGRFSPREISRIAKERKAGSMGYAEAMLTLYNKKSSSNSTLKWAKLYENKRIVNNNREDDAN